MRAASLGCRKPCAHQPFGQRSGVLCPSNVARRHERNGSHGKPKSMRPERPDELLRAWGNPLRRLPPPIDDLDTEDSDPPPPVAHSAATPAAAAVAESRELPTMPVDPCDTVQQHRPKDSPPFPFYGFGMVARQLKKKEIAENRAAQAALNAEWEKLESMKCWLLETVAEMDDVRASAVRDGRTVHFGRIFAICVEKHSELPPEQRTYKGRVVFQGNNVKDQDNNWAVFQEMASSASLLSASKMTDFVGNLPGNCCEQSDAPQAYTQSELGGDETWIIIPPERRPAGWKKFRQPVCRLRLALYGHALSGCFWEIMWKKAVAADPTYHNARVMLARSHVALDENEAAIADFKLALAMTRPGQSPMPAKAICARCPVKAECRAYAIEHDLHGVWGGTTRRERERPWLLDEGREEL